ncbi:hypothetical protein IFM89_025888 [Coptis chinensis]|uniref:DUF3741 domain-containing protein n=1 Tax=Coptis chinensis TaxID=261450 RepID=A0A835HT83_9MAGN|nr:hypothetical protein IFM89_025888 [Coptis chinensis]
MTAGVLQDHKKMEKHIEANGLYGWVFQIFDRHPENTFIPPNASPLPRNYEFKEGLKSTWKFRETPRLSLDSRAIVDAKGSLHPREIRTNAAILSATRCESDSEDDRQRRSPSVVARLMGLDALPESIREPLKKPELRRSEGGGVKRNLKPDQVKIVPISQWKSRKNFFDSEDFFPEPKHTSSLYESPIVVMKSSSKSPGRIGNQSPPSKVSMRRNGDTLPPVRRRQDGGAVSPRLYSNPVSPDRSNEE